MTDWRNKCHMGDCLEVLRQMPDNSVDSIVTDPQYGLGKEPDALVMLRDWMTTGHHEHKSKSGFMGKEWDAFVPQPTIWRECQRVLKPGGYLLAFAGTRTQHLMALGLQIAGFEIRDMIAWVYGSGFPKSHNGEWGGTALKPALEPITMARKPLVGTVEANWREHGTGALNIDGCRIDGGARPAREVAPMRDNVTYQGNALAGRVDGTLQSSKAVGCTDLGRWPANLIHDGSDEVLARFPYTESGTGAVKRASSADSQGNTGAALGAESRPAGTPMVCHGDAGTAARFFYCAKASREDRNEGCEKFERKALNWSSGTKNPGSFQAEGTDRTSPNSHPTVKPTNLMRYLCRLVTPPGGIVLDPFIGSGSTGRAAVLEGFQYIGIERDAGYIEIARARIESARRQGHQPSLDLEPSA